MTKKTKAEPKLETYGPRSMPLIRSAWMTDKQWDAATLELDDTFRRMGKKITWQTRFKRCPQCRADNLSKPRLRFGAVSGLCMPCSNAAVKELLKSFGK
jgi:hypothetical protein